MDDSDREIIWPYHPGPLEQMQHRIDEARCAELDARLAQFNANLPPNQRLSDHELEEQFGLGDATPADAVVFCGDGLYKCGQELIRLDGQEAIVMQTLVELQAASKDRLTDRSGVADAVAVLKRIRRNHPILADAITLPGGKSRGGYRTTIRPK